MFWAKDGGGASSTALRHRFVQNGFGEEGRLLATDSLDAEGEFLGEGSYGQVFMHKCKSTGVRLVVKTVAKPPGWSRDDLVHEAHMMEELDHPHILRLLSWYEQEDLMGMVMDFCAGGELMGAVREGRKTEAMPEKWAATVFRQLFEATIYCHGKGIIHKDLKSDNILLLTEPDAGKHIFSTPPHAIIADWGLAEVVSEGGFFETKGHEVAGTGYTMAPEVWKGSCGQKADIWSLGCVFFQLFTNKMPFDPPDAQLAALPTRAARANVWIELHNKGPNWNLIDASAGAKDLCKGMLKVKEKDRLRAQKCREHAWIVKHCAWSHASKDVLRTACNNIASWANRHPFQKAVCLKLATGYHIEGLSAAFSTMDKDNSGTLSKQEVMSALQSQGVSGDVRKMANALDFKGTGECSFLEFVAACLPGMGEEFSKMLTAEFASLSSASRLGLTGPLVQGFFEKLMATAEFQADVPVLQPNKNERVTIKEFLKFFGPEPQPYRGNVKHGVIAPRAFLKAKRGPRPKPAPRAKVPVEPMEAIVCTAFARQIVEEPAKSDSGSSWGSEDEEEVQQGPCDSSSSAHRQSTVSLISTSTAGAPAEDKRPQPPAGLSPQTLGRNLLSTGTSQSSTAEPSVGEAASVSPSGSLAPPTAPRQPPAAAAAIAEASLTASGDDEMESVPTMLEDAASPLQEVELPSRALTGGLARALFGEASPAARARPVTVSLGEHHPVMDTVEFREAVARPLATR